MSKIAEISKKKCKNEIIRFILLNLHQGYPEEMWNVGRYDPSLYIDELTYRNLDENPEGFQTNKIRLLSNKIATKIFFFRYILKSLLLLSLN